MIVFDSFTPLRIGCIAPRDEPLGNMAGKRGLRRHAFPAYINDYKAQNRSFFPFETEWRFGAIWPLNFVILIFINAQLRLIDKTSGLFRKIIWIIPGNDLDSPKKHPDNCRI
ncbi:MAG: hypothetical protein LBQ78_09350 [Tannerellaceae bacterium]|jgi:hypothetical protein|nr:hypothetical protein [Tannerellaceae bacterium]